MKKKDLYIYLQSLIPVEDLKGKEFASCVYLNKKLLADKIIELEEIITPNPIYEEYEKKRIVLCQVHSEKDENGEPIIENKKYKISNYELFDSELTKLKKLYSDVIEERNIQIKKYEDILEDDIELEFNKIEFDNLPEDITSSQIESIEFMIDFKNLNE